MDMYIDERTVGQMDGRTVLFFQQIIYTQKSHGIIYKWLRDDLVIVVVSVSVAVIRLGARQKASFTLNYCAGHKCQRNMRIPNKPKKQKIFISRRPNKSN